MTIIDIFNSESIPNADQRDILNELLSEIVRGIKKKLYYLALDYKEEIGKTAESNEIDRTRMSCQTEM